MAKLKRSDIKHESGFVTDPFKYLAHGLATDSDEIWEQQPVDIVEFIESKEFLNQRFILGSNNRPSTGCRPKIMEIAIELADDKVREAILLLGKGCLDGSTRIYTREWGYKSMSWLENKYFTVQSYGVNNEPIWNKGVCLNRGVKCTKKYKFSNGMELIASDNHKVNIAGKGVVHINNMKLGDYIRAPRQLLELEYNYGYADKDLCRIVGLSMKPNDQIPKCLAVAKGMKSKAKTGVARYRYIKELGKDENTNIHWVRLISIEEVGDRKVYDIKCDVPFNNYCANGLYPENSGKDFISSILHLYGIYKCQCMYSPQAYYGLAPGSSIYFINVARNETQAKNVFFREFLGHLDNCSWFEGMHLEPGSQHVEFRKSVFALSGNSQAFSWLGYNTIQWVGDEMAFFLEAGNKDEDAAASKSEECWEAAFGSCITRFKNHYKMIGITTPRFDDDFTMHKFYELKRRMETTQDAYVAQAATWEVHPDHTIEDYSHSLERDYRRTMRDYGAQPMGVIETFWGDPDFVDQNVCETCKQCPIYQKRTESTDNNACRDYDDCMGNPYRGNGVFENWLMPQKGAEYYMHFDLSKNKDKTGFAMSHVSDWVDIKLDPFEVQQAIRDEKIKRNPNSLLTDDDMYEERALVKVDFIGYVDPKDNRDPKLMKNKEIYYAGLLKYIVYALLDRGFNIVKVTCDQFASHMFKQTLEEMGITAELLSLDRTDEVPVAAKNCFTENRVEYPYDRVFARESRHLKYIRGNKVDHPTGYGKDVIDGVFGSVYNADTAELGCSAFEMAICGEDDDDD